MPPLKHQEVADAANLSFGDVFVVVIDPTGTPLDRNIVAEQLFPHATTAQMNAQSGEGKCCWNTDEKQPFFHDGTDWLSLVDGLPE